ncbi:unnamed protein product [Allacma fusca]|uniref:Uncharacterized protein n=1 Tax=Allacma fusca TaxID=39272 RepID=A0A8J2K5V2_9HEXA|nr:unnamed protein product [Allacma fusca]
MATSIWWPIPDYHWSSKAFGPDGYGRFKGIKWKNRRKILTHAFHFKMLEVFQQVSNEQSMVLVELMRRRHENHEACPIHFMFSLCALGIICGVSKFLQNVLHTYCLSLLNHLYGLEAAMGTKLQCQEELTVYTQAAIK